MSAILVKTGGTLKKVALGSNRKNENIPENTEITAC